MSNTYYHPGQDRATKVGDLFAKIAPRYDLINDLQSFGLHRLWKRKLVKLAGVKAGDQALDLCCGTGDVALALARQGAETIGLDFSGPMLAVAVARQRRAQKQSRLNQLLYLRGDTLNLPFPDRQFDAVTISYGLRNLANFPQGLAEMRRVAKPGGRLLVLDFGKPDNRLWRGIYFQYLRHLVPVFGKVFCGDAAAYAYIMESLQHYPAQRGIADLMRAAGCQQVRIHNLLGGVMSINYGAKSAG
jgi:demethylmenaquinone methyltransferase/2-methoxy-6-polyprenyl-1,4-benzoquinol methylase